MVIRGNYYKLLNIKKNNFRIEDLFFYINKSDKDNSEKCASIAEAYCVLSHLELKETYDNYFENGKEDVFLKFIGSQFFYFYNNNWLYLKNVEEYSDSLNKKQYCELYQEKVFKTYLIFKAYLKKISLEEENKAKNIIINLFDEEAKKAVDELGERLEKECEESVYLTSDKDSRIRYLFLFHIRVSLLRTWVFLSNKTTEETIEELTKLRFFVQERVFSKEFFNSFYYSLQDEVSRKGNTIEHEINSFLQMKKAVEKLELDRKKLVITREVIIEESTSLESFNKLSFSYEKGWKESYDFLEVFLNKIKNIEINTPSESIENRIMSHFSKKALIIPIVCVFFLLIIGTLILLKKWFFSDEKKRDY